MPEATVAAIAIRPDDPQSILLTRRNIEPFKGQWCLPGGHIDRFEPAEKAVIRELREETGLSFTPRFFGYFDEIIPERDIHAVVMVFVGKVHGDLMPSESEVSEIAWFSLEGARSFHLAFTHNDIVDALVARQEAGP